MTCLYRANYVGKGVETGVPVVFLISVIIIVEIVCSLCGTGLLIIEMAVSKFS